ncbi:hypothetical protein FDECE_14869 [Fusarium decemcellulare]|nr:hypothetical protein FDECE_14869 [Fusarium decemcellulare]
MWSLGDKKSVLVLGEGVEVPGSVRGCQREGPVSAGLRCPVLLGLVCCKSVVMELKSPVRSLERQRNQKNPMPGTLPAPPPSFWDPSSTPASTPPTPGFTSTSSPPPPPLLLIDNPPVATEDPGFAAVLFWWTFEAR